MWSPTLTSTLLHLLLLLSTAEADVENPSTVINITCSPTQTPNPPTFDVSFVSAMENVYQDIARSGFGFSVSGSNSSQPVFGLGQCFSYLTWVDCQLCYSQSRLSLPNCLPSASARVYLSGCFLRYDGYDFSAEAIGPSDVSKCGFSQNVSDSAKFADLVGGLVSNLTGKAYNQSGYYKAGQASSMEGRKRLDVYAVAQCWRSLNESGCRECLENARERVQGCVPASDGRALNTGCYVRYSTQPFYLPASNLSGGHSSHAWRTIVAVLASVLAALLIIGGLILWRRRVYHHLYDDNGGSSRIIRSIQESNLSFKYEDLKNATMDFKLENKLGQGGYGSVYKGVLPDGREIAVKRLFFNTKQWVDQFFNEVKLISDVQHKNLVKLFGCSVEGPESLLVYEYLCNTSLDKFLFDAFKKNMLNWKRRFSIIVGTAEGLAYLHDSSVVRIIHRDIKAGNILLDEKFRPKISDFGLARYFAEGQSHLSTGLAGTLGYMAPEYIIHGHLTEKADVYSYGVLVLEVLTGQRNSNSVSLSSEGQSLIHAVWKHYNSDTVLEMLDPMVRDECSEEQALKVLHVGLLCTQASPILRPSMWKVVEMLNGKSRDLPAPTEPPFINIRAASLRTDGSGTSTAVDSSSKGPVSVNQLSLSIVRAR
ncbi:Cysteine-rich receptor-like protein kinase 2 [Acorus calamus]|uniref:Cysteine-rich receptor-like protein kinase 2 n=1 Tax=Acorus calamus TaxID=4465 RepID=A0AAV9CXI6_ACOCL|nr:Cysteine-rich receptor-like protein kinase 2 [Acorus calamus]